MDDVNSIDPKGILGPRSHSHISIAFRRLSYCKFRHSRGRDGDRDGDRDGHDDHKVQRVRKDSIGRSKETYRLRLDILKQ